MRQSVVLRCVYECQGCLFSERVSGSSSTTHSEVRRFLKDKSQIEGATVRIPVTAGFSVHAEKTNFVQEQIRELTSCSWRPSTTPACCVGMDYTGHSKSTLTFGWSSRAT